MFGDEIIDWLADRTEGIRNTTVYMRFGIAIYDVKKRMLKKTNEETPKEMKRSEKQ
ncbi:hypothetical protein [Paenibacillus sp. D9]|uniref:hypothetical protein n=2 Tax=Paenibacillus TaxID=44249 RepID=UPI000A6E7FA9|nr:hypothetical protein [Paenibacillus sp. D9]